MKKYLSKILICPVCKFNLEIKKKSQISCVNKKCIHCITSPFKHINSKPLLISELLCDTVFDSSNITNVNRSNKIINTILQKLIGDNEITKNNCSKFLYALSKINNTKRILVIGSGKPGEGTSKLWKDESFFKIGIDIYESRHVDIIADAHYLPFADETFDGIWIQAVLEHVASPTVVVEEIHRVLVKNGIVYSEIPFMQQVHEGGYDFTRFTLVGHRYLFKKFKHISSGNVLGPEIALAWSIKYLIWAIFRSRYLAKIIGILLILIFKPLKFFVSKKSAFDSSSGTFLLSSKNDKEISQKQAVNFYKGMV